MRSKLWHLDLIRSTKVNTPFYTVEEFDNFFHRRVGSEIFTDTSGLTINEVYDDCKFYWKYTLLLE